MARSPHSGQDPDDIMRLIADVHTGAPAEEDRLERALGTLESTHRKASAAMLRFERTGKTSSSRPHALAGSLSLGPAEASGGEPSEPTKAHTAAQPKALMGAPVSQEKTSVGPIPHAPPAAATSSVASSERARPAASAPRPIAPVAEVLSGRGAEFTARGHTQTHIVRPPKKPSKK